MSYPILAPNCTWFTQGGTTIKRANITTIRIANDYTPTSTVTSSWDASANKDGSIMAYVEDGTILTLKGNGSGKIKLNADSSFAFSDSAQKDCFINVETFIGGNLLDTSAVTNFKGTFATMNKLTMVDVSNWDTSNVTTIQAMFGYCYALTALDVSNWDVSNVTNMKGTFTDCYALTNLDVSNWDTHNVTTMNAIFQHCINLESLNLSDWDVSNVTNMGFMFSTVLEVGRMALTTIGDVSNWNTHNVTNMKGMFQQCVELETLDVSNWDVSNVTDMGYMFVGCVSLKELDVSNWNVSNVTKMNHMFTGDGNYGQIPVSYKELDVSKWNPSSCTDMSFMFYGCKGIESIDVSNWDVSKVENFDHMFAWNHMVINGTENWITSSATNMYAMFHHIENTTIDVSNFDTSNVQFFGQMFEQAKFLTEIVGLENFDTSKGLGFDEMFRNCAKIKHLNLSSFDTTKAKDGVVCSLNGGKTLTLMNMFSDMRCLETITLGSNFSFNGDGTTTKYATTLPTPSADYITGADGNWYTLVGDAYAVADIPNQTANTYYASLSMLKNLDVLVKNGSLIDIGAAIRTKNGLSTRYLPSEMSIAIEAIDTSGGSGGEGGYDEGFEAGKQDAYNTFWDDFQNNGNRNHYYYAFSYYNFDDSTYNPKYPIKTGTSNTGGQNLFYSSYGITDTKVDIEFEKTANGAFNSAKKLKTIRKMIVNENTTFTNTFNGAEALETINVEGTIGKAISLAPCTLLTKASITSIINALSTTTSGLTLTLSEAAVNKAFETSEGANDGTTSAEWEALGGTNRECQNWTIALS